MQSAASAKLTDLLLRGVGEETGVLLRVASAPD